MPFVIISITPLYFTGIGFACIKSNPINFQYLYTTFGIGLLFFYFLNLLLDINLALSVGGCVSVVGFIRILTGRCHICLKIHPLYFSIIVLGSLFYLHLMLTVPVKDWDASFIWYFAAKIIFFEGAVLNYDVGFVTGYPLLVPAIAANYATLIGVWNELFPGSALFVFYFHVLLGLIFIAENLKISKLIIIVIILTLGRYIWNFYMDGYLALYAALAVFFWGRYLEYFDKNDLIALMISLAILVNIKNEGLLIMLCIIAAGMPYLLDRKAINRVDFRCALLWSITFFPFILWVIHKNQLGLSSGSTIFHSQYFQNFYDRLTNHLLFVLQEFFLVKYNYNYVIVVFVCFFVIFSIKKIIKFTFPTQCKVILFASLLYVLGLLAVYLGTNYGGNTFSGLKLHLDQSLKRVMLTFMTMSYCCIALLIEEIRKSMNFRPILSWKFL